jgi:hypothetical protein
MGEKRASVERDAALWAIRLFVGREPLDEAEIQFHRGHPHIESLRRGFALTGEFRSFYDNLVGATDYRMPLFLMAPPASSRIDWRFSPPTLTAPVSQLCTEAQMHEPAFAEICAQLGLTADLHRKIWEFVWVVAVMRAAGLMRPGVKALGFGVGGEPIPALLAAHGVDVLATDAPLDLVAGVGWDTTGQHATGLDPLRRPHIVDDAALAERVAFRPVDMNAIPEDLRGFDMCWSSCAFEHLGSIEHGLRFVEASLETLKPGGLAIHTTEFNLGSNEATVELPALSIFRKQDIERLLDRLAAAGHRVWPLNLYPGTGPIDAHIDLPPYSMPHLKLRVASEVTTSIGLVVERG